MKQFIFMFLVASLLFSCKQEAPTETFGASFDNKLYKTLDIDDVTVVETSGTNTTYDTLDQSLGRYNRPVDYEIYIVADSLSGAIDGTILLQQNLEPAGETALWETVSTVTVNGVQTTSKLTGSKLGGEFRLYGITANATQSYSQKVAAVFAEQID